jgi:uncharacterized protein GlcG (DUF336 family)
MITHLNVPTISYAYATEIIARVLDTAERAGVRAIVTVVDPALALVAFARADGATPHSVETSRRKAVTAASTRKPSSALNPELATALEHGTGGILTRVKGGVPIVVDGITIGGLGVAGGLPDQDEAIALEAIAALSGTAGA